MEMGDESFSRWFAFFGAVIVGLCFIFVEPQHRIIGTLMLFAAGYVLNHNLHWKERLSQRSKADK